MRNAGSRGRTWNRANRGPGRLAENHAAQIGNDEVLDALHRGAAVVVVSPTLGRVLPAVMQHAATHRLSLPAIDEWAVALAIEATIRAVPDKLPPPEVLRRLQIKDLPLVVRANRTAGQCVEAIVASTQLVDASADGPTLEELHGFRRRLRA